MRVSVVIPTYNCGPFAVEAVRSVLAQTVPAHEIIVVDDGSTDDTASRVAEFGSRVRYIRKENGGVSSARNRGIAEATGDLIAFLDADDVWHPRKLEIQVTVLENHPEIGLVGTSTYNWPTAIHPSPPDLNVPLEEITFDKLLTRNRLCTSTVVARASAIRAAGEFDCSLQGPEDYDMWLRIARQSTIASLPIPLTGYRMCMPSSLSKNAVRMETGLRMILSKLKREGAFEGRRLLQRKAWGYFRYSSGIMYRDAGHPIIALDRYFRSLLGCPFRIHPGPGGGMCSRLRLVGAIILKGLFVS